MTNTVETTSAKPQEDWMARRWRPMMGWMYMVVCTFDFMVAPILWSVLQTVLHQTITQWNPLTLQGAGLFHVAMGAVLGVAAYGRTQEKLGGANNGGLQLPTSGATTPGLPSTNPAPVTNSWGSQPLGSGSGFGSAPPAATNFGSTPFAAPMPPIGPTAQFDNTSAEVITGFGGKKAPPPITDYPER